MNTKHTHTPNFGRKVEGCPRCAELAAGAKPIVWRQSLKAETEAQLIQEIRAHDCKKSGCGPVCTAFDW